MKGHIRPRGEGAWAIILDVGVDPETGRRRQKWHNFRGTKRAAEGERTRLLHELQTGAYVERSKLTMRDYLQRWLKDYALIKVSGKTYERYAEIVRCHLIPNLGQYGLSDLRPLQIQSYYSQSLLSGRRNGKGALSARTVLHHHRILHQALHQAVKWQLLARNPADAVEPPQPSKKEMLALDEGQTSKLLDAARSNRLLQPAVLLAATTGLRRGEVLALRWRDIDFESASLAVRRSLSQTKAGLSYKEPKTIKGRRTVALPGLLIEALRRHRAEQARARLMLGPAYEDNDLVCCRVDGKPFQPSSVTHEFIMLSRDCGLPNIHFHTLRHSHATLLLRRGVHPKIVSERLGHSTIGITLDVYSHVLPGMQEEAARQVDVALRSAIAKPSA